MKVLCISALLVLLAAGSASAQPEQKFATCTTRTGKAYQEARDQFLAAKPDAGLLKQRLKSDSWRESMTARILLGWIEHRDAYLEILDAPKIVNQAGEAHYLWAVNQEGIQFKHVPLMYELLTKEIDAEAARDATLALLALVRREPRTPLAVSPLHQFLRDKQSPVPERATVAWLLGSLPAEYQEGGDELHNSLKAELARADKDRDVILFLLPGFAHAAQAATGKEKDQLTQTLLDTPGLEQAVGKSVLTAAVDNIGGDKASALIVQHLKKSPDQIEQLWAIRTLSNGDSKVAEQALLALADDPKDAVKNEAIEALARARYLLPEVAAKLEAIALQTKDARQQFLASYSLVSLEKNTQDVAVKKQIQDRILTISTSSSNVQLRQELKDLLKKVKK